MTTLDPKAGYVTPINTFTVDPSRSEELLEILHVATVERIRHLPGFISANLHVSLDRRNVTNYAQWTTREAMDAMRADPQAKTLVGAAASVATSFDPIVYDLRYATERPKASS